MSVKNVENNNLESIVFKKINWKFLLDMLFRENSPMQLFKLDGTNNQMTLTRISDDGGEDRAILHFSHHTGHGTIDQSKSFRLIFNGELETVKAVESDGFGSLEELNNLF